MVGRFRRRLDAVVADPRQRLSALSQIDATERRQLLDWNVSAAPYPIDATIHELFEDAGRPRTPEAVAAGLRRASN